MKLRWAAWTSALTLLLANSWGCDDDSSAGAASDAGLPTNDSSAPLLDSGPPPLAAFRSYIIPGTESMAALTINRTTGEFFVDSSESGKIYRAQAGANAEAPMELLVDLTGAGIARGGHMALSPDGKTLYVLASLAAEPRVSIVDVATRTLVKTASLPGPAGAPFTLLQDIAVSPDGKTLYASNSFQNVIHTLDLTTFATSTFPLSSEFPYIATTSQGFINATGITISNDGKFLLLAHIIDKHLYRVSLASDSLGKTQQIDTGPYNVSGNGLWLGTNDEALEVAGDELRIYRFKMNADHTKGEYQGRYQGDILEQGLTYAVAHEDRVLVLNGSGLSPFVGGGAGGPPPGDAGGFPPLDGGGLPPPTGDAGTRRLPIKVLQLPR